MKRFLIAAAVAAAAVTTPALADVAVSVSIGQPGFYGRLDIGGYPEPQVVYAQPVIVERVAVERQPIYLRVPPGHAKHWSRHCREYNACGERVYFVQNDWYNREYAPRYQEKHRDHGNGYRDYHGNDHRDYHGDDHRDYHGDDHRGDRGDHGDDRHGDKHDRGHDH